MDGKQETAIRGKVLKSVNDHYLVDFSEYGQKQGYLNLEKPLLVDEESCIGE